MARTVGAGDSRGRPRRGPGRDTDAEHAGALGEPASLAVDHELGREPHQFHPQGDTQREGLARSRNGAPAGPRLGSIMSSHCAASRLERSLTMLVARPQEAWACPWRRTGGRV